MRVARALLHRLLVSVAAVFLTGGFEIVYGDKFGPSQIAYSASVVLIAWPWALPQIFLVVCIVWFVYDVRNKNRLDPKSLIALAMGVTNQRDECMSTHIHVATTRQPLREIMARAEVAGTSS